MATASLRRLLARRLPWWLVGGCGVAAIVLGAVLISRPFESLSILHWLVAAVLVLIGINELMTADDDPRPLLAAAMALVWILAAVLAVAWPDLTLVALAGVLAVALIAGGVVKLIACVSGRGDDRVLLALRGATHLVTGVLAIAWPAATILVLSIVAGTSAIVFGAGQIATGMRLRAAAASVDPEAVADRRTRWPRWIRIAATSVALLLALGGSALSVAIHRADPDEPGPFYEAPESLPDGGPGTIIRTEIIDGYIDGATTYRVLYVSTRRDGEPTAVSGVIVVPDAPAPAGGRPVLAYTHGTVGVTPKCAPSLASAATNPMLHEGGREFIDAGYVIAATDYQGLGTAGVHPYLVGEVEAMNELDMVRAARLLPEAQASDSFVVWGHSQGGHASLFTGQMAATYAPELSLLGVAAGGPVPDLIGLFKFNLETLVGKILISMALYAWSDVYGDAQLSDIVTPIARPVVGKLAKQCLYSQTALIGALPNALLLQLTFLSVPLWDVEPWNTIAHDNTPGATAISVPVLVVQGLADEIVAPDLTAALVDRMCAAGETVDYVAYDGIGHLDTGIHAVPDVVAWVNARFAGSEAPSSCG